MTTHRMLVRMQSPRRLAFFADVQLVPLITQDPHCADEFIKRVFGGLESARAPKHPGL
jgi:hypothetical protein